jgi:two-component system response regulator DesR
VVAYDVLLVDDEDLLRESLAIILASSPLIGRVAQACRGADAVRLARQENPAVVVLDYDMPGADGLATARALLQANPARRVLMLTRFGRPGLMRSALRLGVAGFLTKAAAPNNVVEAIAEVAQGKRYFDPEMIADALAIDCPLTDRELEVIHLLGRGRSTRSIASELHLAYGTVRNYLSSALMKAGVESREHLVEVAREKRWI